MTQFNIDQVSNGQIDEPLAEEGKEQAQKLADRLEDRGIEIIYSSPLKRATMTAMPIADRINKEINVDRRLMEVSLGSFEGRPYKEVEKELGKTIRDFLDDYSFDFTKFGGESSKQVEERVSAFLDDLKKTNYQTVLIITHGGILRWIKYIVTGEKAGPHSNAEESDLVI